MKFYTKFNPPPKKAVDVSAPSMTCQEFKDECDINNIVKKPNYGINPLMPPTRKPTYGDFTDIAVKDFYAAQTLIADANSMFEMLDSSIRDRFENDPGKLLDFVNDPRNIDEGVKIGLFDKHDVESSITPMSETVTSPAETPLQPATPSVEG